MPGPWDELGCNTKQNPSLSSAVLLISCVTLGSLLNFAELDLPGCLMMETILRGTKWGQVEYDLSTMQMIYDHLSEGMEVTLKWKENPECKGNLLQLGRPPRHSSPGYGRWEEGAGSGAQLEC